MFWISLSSELSGILLQSEKEEEWLPGSMKKKEMEKGSSGWGSWTVVKEAGGLQLEADARQRTEGNWHLSTCVGEVASVRSGQSLSH